MRIERYPHRFGDAVIPPATTAEIEEAIEKCRVRPGRRMSVQIRETILEALKKRGWTAEFEVDPVSKITITSIKNRIGLCLQTGNMSRMYADILKLQALYLRSTIDGAFLIVPTHAAATKLGQNIANSDRLSRELALFERIVTVPLLILGIE